MALEPDTAALIRHVDRHLAVLGAWCDPYEMELAEAVAALLRALVLATAGASAADRARARAAVHYFVRRAPRPGGTGLREALRVAHRAARDLGRDDLVTQQSDAVAGHA